MKTLLSAVVGATLALSAIEANGQATPGERQVALAIESKTLAAALDQWAQQSGFQILLENWELAKSLPAPRLVGTFSARDALEKLLDGTPLTYSWVDQRIVSIRTKVRPASSGKVSDPAENPTDQKIRVAQLAPNEEARSSRSAQVPAGLGQHPGEYAMTESIDEVVVTGSHIRGVPLIGSQLIALTQSDISSSGYATVQDVLATLPQHYGGSPSETTAVVGLGGRAVNRNYGSSINLRGLGADSTLVLLNGRRMAPAGSGAFVDVSAVPLSMIERIEVVPDGASATYGSDAVGGVVNLILRKGYDGAETSVRYGTLSGGDAPGGKIAQTFGSTWDGGRLLLGYEYYRRDALDASERSYAANSDLRSLGGSNFSSTQSNPGNIASIGGVPSGLAVPRGQNGTGLTDASFVAGQPNFQNAQETTDLLPKQEQHSAVLSISQDLGERWSVFLDGLFSSRDAEARDTRLGSTIVVPATNAYRVASNLFAGRGPIVMNYNLTDDLGPNDISSESRTYSAAFGTSVEIGSSWRAEVFGEYGKLRDQAQSSSEDVVALNAALASGVVDTAFNPFADGSNTSAAVLRSISGAAFSELNSDIRSVHARADGAFLTLPGGDAKLALGAELRKQRFNLASSSRSGSGVVTRSPDQPLDREIRAAFAEVSLPLVTDSNSMRGIASLQVSLSARYEDYDDVGDTFNPRIGVQWSPLNGFAVTGSYGTSFKAPLLVELGAPSFAQVAPIPAFIDPLATNGSTLTLLVSGANKRLKPETADTWTAGLHWLPLAMPGLKVDASYFDIMFVDRIATPDNGLRVFAQPEVFGNTLIRNPTQAQVDAMLSEVDRLFGPPPPPGSIEAILDIRLVNRSSVHVNGIDLGTSYEHAAAIGRLLYGISASYLLSYDERFVTTSPVAHNLNTVDRPVDLRLRGSLSWSQGPFGASSFINYVDNYKDTLSTPRRKVGSWTTVDLQLSYETPAADRWYAGVVVTLTATNLIDKDPPFVNNPRGFGFDPANANAFGRQIALDISRKW